MVEEGKVMIAQATAMEEREKIMEAEKGEIMGVLIIMTAQDRKLMIAATTIIQEKGKIMVAQATIPEKEKIMVALLTMIAEKEKTMVKSQEKAKIVVKIIKLGEKLARAKGVEHRVGQQAHRPLVVRRKVIPGALVERDWLLQSTKMRSSKRN